MRSQTQTKPTPKPSFTPVKTGLLQRKCACGNSASLTGKCTECENKRLSLQRRANNQAEPDEVPPIVHEVLREPGIPLDAATRAFMEPRFGHDFSQVRVHTDTKAVESAWTANRFIYNVSEPTNQSKQKAAELVAKTAKQVEAFPGEDIGTSSTSRLKRTSLLGGLLGGGIGGVLGGIAGFFIGGPIGAVIGAGLGAVAGGLIGNAVSGSGTSPAASGTPTLSLSNDTYNDTPTQSQKNIQFNVTLPSGHNPTDYALVNWVKGYARDSNGYFQARVYGSVQDVNFPNWQVDSVDPDPVYWSQPTGRWNYNITPNGFNATDSPGPALSRELGAVYALNFKIGLYRLRDLPTTTTGSISATPISERPWQYSVVVNSATGAFSHPNI